jgi:probable rRNA maturation factor
MVINRQDKISVDLRAAREFVQRLRKCLRLGRRDFNVCFVKDREIAELNATFRMNPGPTDVLSFPWRQPDSGAKPTAVSSRHRNTRKPPARKTAEVDFDVRPHHFANFLGDIVISAETARRNAKEAGISTAREIRWLILHGVLHLMGYDHETDNGRMTAVEHSVRTRLNI